MLTVQCASIYYMATTAQFFHGQLRLASQSFGFQQYLRLNPKAAKRAMRDRDRVVLEYLQEQQQRAVAEQKINTFSNTASVLVEANCGDIIDFQLGPGSVDIPTVFNFKGYPEGNALLVHLGLGPTDGLPVYVDLLLSNLTDDCMLFVGNPGISEEDTVDVSNFTYLPNQEGTSDEHHTLQSDVTAAHNNMMYFVVYHKGTQNSVTGKFTLTCNLYSIGNGAADYPKFVDKDVDVILDVENPAIYEAMQSGDVRYGAYATFVLMEETTVRIDIGPPISGPILADDAVLDTVLHLFTGESYTGQAPIASNNDIGNPLGTFPNSSIAYTLQPGQYVIECARNDDVAFGRIALHITTL